MGINTGGETFWTKQTTVKYFYQMIIKLFLIIYCHSLPYFQNIPIGVCTLSPVMLGLIMLLALANSLWGGVAHPHSSRSFRNHCVWISNIFFSLFDMKKVYHQLGLHLFLVLQWRQMKQSHSWTAISITCEWGINSCWKPLGFGDCWLLQHNLTKL